MIISASYKTDILTFYVEWFVNRLRAGYCKTVNPFNRVVSRGLSQNYRYCPRATVRLVERAVYRCHRQ